MKKDTNKLTKRQLQAMETRDKIYNAAITVINERGYNNVSIEDITTCANVAKGSFYTYFESKEDLVFYTFKQSDEVYQVAYEQVQDEDFLSMIVDFVRISYQEYEKRGKGIIKAMISNYFTFPDYNFYGEERNLLKCLERIVEAGKSQGVLHSNRPTYKYIELLLSTLIGVEVMWCIDTSEASLADMIAEAIRNTAIGMMA